MEENKIIEAEKELEMSSEESALALSQAFELAKGVAWARKRKEAQEVIMNSIRSENAGEFKKKKKKSKMAKQSKKKNR